MTRDEALKAAKSSYDASKRASDMRYYAELTFAADAYIDEKNRINKEYPQ
jgi:ribosome-binding factor A